MTDDIEARVRAALHAYAEQVEDTDAELPQLPAAAEPGGSWRRWRAAVLVAAAVVAVIGGAWWIGFDRPGADVVDATTDGTSADDSAAQPATGLATAPEGGVPYALDLYTHCGVLGTDIDGTWFAADPPLVEEYGPPPGWGNPYQPGELTPTSADEAVFTDDLGHRLLLRAAPDSARPPLCD